MKVFHILQTLLIIISVQEDGSVEELAETPKVHWDLIVEAHQLGRSIKVLRVDTLVQSLYGSLHQLPIDVHGVFIEAEVEVISEILVLGFPGGRLIQIEFVEWMLKDVLWLHHINWGLHSLL